MASKIFRPRRGTSSGLGTSTVLASGELFFEYPSGGVGTGKVKVKMGDGSTAYSSLPYAINTDVHDGDASDATVTFTQATSTSNSTLLTAIASGATIATLVGNIKQMLSNLNDSVTSLNNDITTINSSLDGLDTTTLAATYAPISHASTDTTYGIGTSSNYGHVKLSDNYTSSAGAASAGVGASSTAVYNCYSNRAPISHASTATTYGGGTSSNYGHVKVSDNYTSSAGAASASVAASSTAVYNVYTKCTTSPTITKPTLQWDLGTSGDSSCYVQLRNSGASPTLGVAFVHTTDGGSTNTFNNILTVSVDSDDNISSVNFLPTVMKLTGGTFTGVCYAQSNTSYTTYQVRNIAFVTSVPSSLTNGRVAMVYTA